MRAITFDIRPSRIVAAKAMATLSPRAYVSGLGPTRCEHVADPVLAGDDWLIVEPRFAGICGSDVMQVFLKAASDNPLSAVVSSPHVMGHEVAGVVMEAGRSVRRFAPGDRVVVSPWLPCAPRGLPPCEACAAGRFPLCSRFFDGKLAKGMHLGNCRDVGGGFAGSMALHESMLFPVPDDVPLDEAALADPFAVALHAVLRAPPAKGETVLVYGCGSLGLLAIQILAVLFPGVTVLAVDHKPRLLAYVKKLGAHRFFTSRGNDLVGEIAAHFAAPVRKPFRGTSWISTGVHRVYDTVGSGGSLEIGLRVVRPRGSIVVVGVAEPRRFEWTPLYFKEVSLLGSNAYGVETVDGEGKHAIEFYLELLRDHRITLDGMVTHRFPLERFDEAFMAAYDKRSSGAIKVLFEPNPGAEGKPARGASA